jgi:putative methionine-R-sulfoxide reductase with GAF domain
MNRSMAADLARVADSEAPRKERAHAAAEMIRGAGEYRSVGIYDVGDEQIALIGYSGSAPPDPPAFPVTDGLTGDAVRTRSTVVNATRSQTIVPILGAESGIVIGTLDVEGERRGTFAPDGVAFLENCAAMLRPLYD